MPPGTVYVPGPAEVSVVTGPALGGWVNVRETGARAVPARPCSVYTYPRVTGANWVLGGMAARWSR